MGRKKLDGITESDWRMSTTLSNKDIEYNGCVIATLEIEFVNPPERDEDGHVIYRADPDKYEARIAMMEDIIVGVYPSFAEAQNAINEYLVMMFKACGRFGA